jgi:hypothetical protein
VVYKDSLLIFGGKGANYPETEVTNDILQYAFHTQTWQVRQNRNKKKFREMGGGEESRGRRGEGEGKRRGEEKGVSSFLPVTEFLFRFSPTPKPGKWVTSLPSGGEPP